MWGDLGEGWSQREHVGWGSPEEPAAARRGVVNRGRMGLGPPLSLVTKNSLTMGLWERERGQQPRGGPVGLTCVDWPQGSGVSEGE